MKRIFAVALGILTAIGGFLDIGDIVTNAVVGSRFGWSLAWVVVVPHCLSTSVRQSKASPSVRAHVSTFYGLGWTMTSFDWLTGMTVTG
ncbi:MAG: hypothetical protein R2742_02310 [Micropruina glycogenica]